MGFLDSLNRAFGRHWDFWFKPVPLKHHAWYQEPLFWFIVGALAVCVVLFFMLQGLPRKARKRLIMLSTFAAGLFYLLEFVIPGAKDGDNALSAWLPRVGDGATVIASFTWGLGLINLAQIHGKALARLKSGWYNSLAFFVGFFGISIFGLWSFYASQPDKAGNPGVPPPFVDQTYTILFKGFYLNLGASVFSLLAFYIVSAAYRAFRIRSREATLMMLAAFIVMLGQIPLGMWLTHSIPDSSIWSNLRVESISEWLLSGINSAAQRGISFGMAVGALAMSLRIWLSLERGSFFDAEV